MPYLFNSRILTHVTFWVCYYLLFGFIWARDGNYQAAYFLEFVLLPIRIGVAYVALYVLLPRLLLKKKFVQFIIYFGLALIIGAVLQRLFIYFFLERNETFNLSAIFAFRDLLRAIILINSTALFLLALKVLFLYLEEKDKAKPKVEVEIKSDRRFYKIGVEDILFVEGLGNYVTYHLGNEKKIISYTSLKQVEQELPENFVRIHKSYLINTERMISYNNETVEMRPDFYLPIGNAYKQVVSGF